MTSTAVASAGASAPALPEVLQGKWQTQCATALPKVLELMRTRALRVDENEIVACRLDGSRALTERRWYLDFTCADGTLLHLDLNLRAPGRALIARRPLGEACVYAAQP